jgi:hypothetical protein
MTSATTRRRPAMTAPLSRPTQRNHRNAGFQGVSRGGQGKAEKISYPWGHPVTGGTKLNGPCAVRVTASKGYLCVTNAFPRLLTR